MTQTTIDTTGHAEADGGTFNTARHPYLVLAEVLEDLERLAGVVARAAAELAPALRAATPPSVQNGREVAHDNEPQGFVDTVALDRLLVQCSMVRTSLDVVTAHAGGVANDHFEAGVGAHLATDDDDDD